MSVIMPTFLCAVCIIGLSFLGELKAQRSENSGQSSSDAFICEGRSRFFNCNDPRHVLFIENAFYGRKKRDICPDASLSEAFRPCSAYHSFTTIWRQCQGKRSCTLFADRRYFGDRCTGVAGYIFVQYRCANPGSSVFGECSSDGSWGSWINSDNPKGSGDFELFVNHRKRGSICEEPLAMEVRLANGQPYEQGQNAIKLGFPYGATCVNRQQEDGVCRDYKVRYCCESYLEVPTNKPVIVCLRPQVPSYGFMYAASARQFPVGTVIQFSCREGYELVGSDSLTCTSSSRWSTRVPVCAEIQQDEISYCISTSYPHYETFDGRFYKFKGMCSYLLARSIRRTDQSTDTFQVEIASYRSINGELQRRVNIKMFEKEVSIESGGRVKVDGVLVRLPFSEKAKFNVGMSGRFISLNTSFHLRILHDGGSHISLGVPAAYRGNVEGLCGNFNGRANDDFLAARGRVYHSDPEKFGNHYRLSSNVSCSENSASFMQKLTQCRSSREMQRYRSNCYLIVDNRGPLRRCSLQNKQRHFENCMYDMCVHDGSRKALENSVAAFTQKCQAEGVTLFDWRTATRTPLQCGPNSRYTLCGSGCPRTCVSISETEKECSSQCVEGCECLEGFVLSDMECVPELKCGCLFEGEYYKDEELFYSWSCSRKCECRNGVTSCSRHSCKTSEKCERNPDGREECVNHAIPACRAWGAPQYVTFDGNGWFDFVGRCEYVMTEAFTLLPTDPRWFAVHARSEARQSNVTYLFFGEVEVYLQNRSTRIKLYKNGTVTVNGNAILEAETDAFTLSRFGSSPVVSTKHGLEVSFTGQVLHIRLPRNYRGKVRGLCGNNNGNPSDDLQQPSESSENRQDQLARLYQLGSCQSDHGPLYVCPSETLEIWKSVDFCGALTDPTGYFKDCHGLVKPDMFAEKCLFDVCVNEGDKNILAKCIEEYVEACKMEGIEFCDWRSKAISGLPQVTCPNRSTFGGCASLCQDTCFKSADSKNCPRGTAEDCVCDAGYLREANKCIRRSDCGCKKDGYYIEKGSIIFDETEQTNCRCLGADEFSCSCADGFVRNNGKCQDINECSQNKCHSDAECYNTPGSYYCECPDGKVGDGTICQDPSCPRPSVSPAAEISPDLPRYPVQSVVTYSCPLGYEIIGFPQRVCSANGQWANEEPRCQEKIVCLQPDFVENGRYLPEKQIYQVGETVYYSCFGGIQIRGSPVKRCAPTGLWTGETPSCQVQCPMPRAPENGAILSPKSIYLEGDAVDYACNKGYNLMTSKFRVCLPTGNWAGEEPRCAEAVCPPPPERENGFFSPAGSGTWTVGSTITYKCNDGYASPLWKIFRSTCLPTRKWSEEPTPCSDIDECRASLCDVMDNMTNTRIEDCLKPIQQCHENADCFNRPGSYGCVCRLGYVGDGRNECIISVPCPINQTFANGEIDAATPLNAQAGEVIIHQCDKGYTLVGDPVNTCQNDGRWSNKPPTCEDENECELFPCHKDATCSNTPGSYICFCEEGYIGDGYDNCTECQIEDCGCIENGLTYNDGELFWTENCEEQCVCESGAILCERIPCDESQSCVQKEDRYLCEGADKCELKRRIIEIPDCLDRYNRTQLFNSGKCTVSSCSTRDDTCCGIALEEVETLLCYDTSGDTYPLNVHRIARCDCQACVDSRTTFKGRAFGLDKNGEERNVKFAEVYKDEEFMTNTDQDGSFTMYMDSGRHNMLLHIKDNQNEFLPATKEVEFRKNGGVLFMNIQIPKVLRNPSAADSTTDLVISLEKANIKLKPYSFYSTTGRPYVSRVSYKSKYVSGEGHEIETTPGRFQLKNKDLLLFYDVLYAMFRGRRNQALMATEAEILPSINAKGYQERKDLFLWKWDSDENEWKQKDKFKMDASRKNLTCAYDLADEHNYIAIARSVSTFCYIKVVGYRKNTFRSSEQMANLIAKGIYTKKNVWHTRVQSITTASHGTCLAIPCDNEEYEATFQVIINGNVTLNPQTDLDIEVQKMYGMKVNAERNSVDIRFHPSRIENDALIYESFDECMSAPIRNSHLRFYLQSKDVSEFNIAPIDEHTILHTWFNSPLIWWPSSSTFSACYMKIGIRGVPVAVQARSYAGQRPDIIGSLYGSRKDVSKGEGGMYAACIEVKCSGRFLDAVTDVTMVDIVAEGSCNRTIVNPTLKTLNKDVYLSPKNNQGYRMYYPLNDLGYKYGLYQHSSRDLFISKYTALRKCHHGNGGVSNVMVPGDGLAMVFDCL